MHLHVGVVCMMASLGARLAVRMARDVTDAYADMQQRC